MFTRRQVCALVLFLATPLAGCGSGEGQMNVATKASDIGVGWVKEPVKVGAIPQAPHISAPNCREFVRLIENVEGTAQLSGFRHTKSGTYLLERLSRTPNAAGVVSRLARLVTECSRFEIPAGADAIEFHVEKLGGFPSRGGGYLGLGVTASNQEAVVADMRLWLAGEKSQMLVVRIFRSYGALDSALIEQAQAAFSNAT